MAVTLRQLTYLLALAEEQSFVRAAARVHVTQPALSMQIRELEATLGLALVERLPREVRLTRGGREVVARARRVLAEVAELDTAARLQGAVGPLNLGIIPTVAPYLLPRALAALGQAEATRHLRVREARTETLLAELDRGLLDVVVIAEPAPAPGYVAACLFEDRFLLAGSAVALARLGPGQETLRPRALDPDQLLLLDEGHCLVDQVLEVCGLNRRQARVDLGASSLATLCGLVGQGFGLTFLPELAVATEAAAAPEMRLRRFAAPEPARRIVLLRRAATDGGDWFRALAGILSAAGCAVIAEARAGGVAEPPAPGSGQAAAALASS